MSVSICSSSDSVLEVACFASLSRGCQCESLQRGCYEAISVSLRRGCSGFPVRAPLWVTAEKLQWVPCEGSSVSHCREDLGPGLVYTWPVFCLQLFLDYSAIGRKGFWVTLIQPHPFVPLQVSLKFKNQNVKMEMTWSTDIVKIGCVMYVTCELNLGNFYL